MTNDILVHPFLRPIAALRSLAIGLCADALIVAGLLVDIGADPLGAFISPSVANKIVALCVIVSAVSKVHLAVARSVVPIIDSPTK